MDGPQDPLPYDLLRAIRRIVRQVQAHSRTLSREAGLTVPQLLCLRAIASAEDPLTVAALSRAVQLSPSTVSGVLDRLERASLVARRRDTVDRRRVFLDLTEAGQAAIRDLPLPLQERFLARVRELPPDDRASLLTALERVVRLMDAEDIDVAPVLSPQEDLRVP